MTVMPKGHITRAYKFDIPLTKEEQEEANRVDHAAQIAHAASETSDLRWATFLAILDLLLGGGS